MMPDPKVDKFKVWPTQLDRPAFAGVVESGSPEALKELFPLVRQKWARKPDPRPRLVECYLYFYGHLDVFFKGTAAELPLASDSPLEQRLEACFQSLRGALMVVAIDLEQGDDAQVIFETLNARGQALLPADLLRNYIFLRATRNGEKAEELYEQYWSSFDEPYWQEAVSQGRLNRPRSDLFMQHFLASQQTTDIPIAHLYTEYRHWIEKKKPFPSVEAELSTLAEYRDRFRKLLDVAPEQPFTSLAQFLKAFDIGTVYPFMLRLLSADVVAHETHQICSLIESYLLRRAVCGLTNKNYNRVFLQLARGIRRDNVSAEVVSTFLQDLRGESTEWPSDEVFRAAWQESELYRVLSNPRLVFIFMKLNNDMASSKTEEIRIEGPMSVEHLMPQGWIANWRLPDGSQGIDEFTLWDMDEDAEPAKATRERNHLIQTMGNLTIVRHGLNSALSNAGWVEKKAQLMDHSLLPLNLPLQSINTWDEQQIRLRGRSLLARALKLWPGPSQPFV